MSFAADNVRILKNKYFKLGKEKMDEIHTMLKERAEQAQKILVGIGEEFQAGDSINADGRFSLERAYQSLSRLLCGRDYFVVTLQEKSELHSYDFEEERMTAPCEDEEEQWKNYQDWLSGTLNKELLILELGVGFTLPGIIRWPFEKVAFYNNKAYLVRVHEKFPQLTSELQQKGIAVRQNSVEFCANL